MAEEKDINIIAESTDASQIEGSATSVIFPSNVEEIRQAIIAGKNLVVRGGGSGLAGGCVPQNSVVIDLSKMNKIIEIYPNKGIVEVEAGVILDELNDKLAGYGLEFPVKPSSHAICTIGGMIATNAVGNRAVKYKRTSDWVENLEVINGKAEVLELAKASTSDFCGMEGITGVIVKAKLRLIEKKERTASLFPLDSLEKVVEVVKKLKLMNDISAVEFIDKVTSQLIGMRDKYNLIVEFESGKGKAKGKEYEDLMELRDKVYPILAQAGYTIIEDPKVLLHKFEELADYLEANKIPFFGHIAVGIIHPVFKQGEEEKIAKMLAYVRRISGQVSGEHGIGLRKKEFVEPSDKRLLINIKKRQDPFCKINCGKVIDMDKSEAENGA